MFDVEKVVGCARRIAPIIIGVVNWSILAAIIGTIETALAIAKSKWSLDPSIETIVRGAIYGTLICGTVLTYFGRRRRAKAKLYNYGTCIHDPDSGRDIHYEWFAGFCIPNLLVNPWAVLAPIMCNVVRVSKNTGTASCTPKTTEWVKQTDGVRWNLGRKGCNEWITGTSANHLRNYMSWLNGSNSLDQQYLYVKEGLQRMVENGLHIEGL